MNQVIVTPPSKPQRLEPIAIVGIGCRFPGNCNDWKSYWRLLSDGVDAVSETPPTRWNLQKFYHPNLAVPGKTQSKWGGYISDIDRFDPQLFHISPREAASMDPQQRMLLEVAYRAIEDAGTRLEQIAGQSVSVFVGISSFDYAVAGLSFQDRGVITPYSNTGGSSSIAANRISYCFDLRGPSVAVDTACSSSLVAVHMACESIWRGEAKMALAGGVNALILPDFYVAFSQLGVLSPDGRCKTFDARANGYVRSEGAGMVMLKPLSTAIRDRDPIYAVVRSTALNQDGRTPGMTVPSREAQQLLAETACRKAGIDSRSISYVEAHGTGTPVGDPIEANALGAVFGKDRPNPCWVGSVKTNIGHLEAGAGIASLIKVALALHHQKIPAHLNFASPNPDIDLNALNLAIPTKTIDWSVPHGPRLAGINGFGYGGANAHVILEQAPVETQQFHPSFPAATNEHSSAPDKIAKESKIAPVLVPLSARSRDALLKSATVLADWLDSSESDYPLPEIAGYYAHRRTHHEVRTTVCSKTKPEMIEELRRIAASSTNELPEDLSTAKLARGIAFICSGQGPQWWAMGRGLLKYSPVFRAVIKRCDAEFSKYAAWSLYEELNRSESQSRMQVTSIAQPSIFAIQIALAALWESWGVKPSCLVGHSVGEIAAAYISGSLSFEDAALVAFQRGRTMDLATSKGGMIAAGLSVQEATQWIEEFKEEVAIAAVNGPSSITISGASDAIEAIGQRLETAGIFCRRLAVEYAFHSPQMEPVRSELLDSLRSIHPRTNHTPLISTVTGNIIDGTQLDGEYWWQNVRQSVRFADAMYALARQGFGLTLEVGPHPVLGYSIHECFQHIGSHVLNVSSLNRQQDDLQCITKSLGQLYAAGVNIDWSGFYNKPLRKVQIPSYPFQLQRCWSESLESELSRNSGELHPLLGEQTIAPDQTWEQRIDLKRHTYLSDHKVRGSAVYPAAAMIETTVVAAQKLLEQKAVRLNRFRLHGPCVLGEDHPHTVQTKYDPERRQLRLFQRDSSEAIWQPLASTDIASLPSQPDANVGRSILAEVRSRCKEAFDSDRLYQYCQDLGLQYGENFRGVVDGVRCDGEALLAVEANLADPRDESPRYTLHPAVLDSCFHGMIAADYNFDHTRDGLYLPAEIEVIEVYRPLPPNVVVHVRLLSKSKKLMVCDLDVYSPEGELCCSIRRFESRRVQGGQTAQSIDDMVYRYAWELSEEPIHVDDSTARTAWLVLMDEIGVGRELCALMRRQGREVIEIYRDNSQVAQAGGHPFFLVKPNHREGYEQAFESIFANDNPAIEGLVYLWGLDAPNNEHVNCNSLDQSSELTSIAPLYLLQAYGQQLSAPKCKLVIATSGAQSPDGSPESCSLAQSPLIGFGRVIISENAHLTTRLIDLPCRPSARDIEMLWNECVANDNEDEVMLRKGARFVRRFRPQTSLPASVSAVEERPIRLRIGRSNAIEELRYETGPERELVTGEVEIEVFAAGLNFSDVMKVLDLYPGLADGPVALGAECSGRITRVAEGSRWEVGTEVVAIAPGAFATRVIVNEHLVARKPTSLTHQEAATIPVAFLTAQYAMSECARLREGDTMLLHAASGGVGLAALQLSRLLGVRVLATAGTNEKREFVRKYGAEYVMDSRRLEFGEQTLNYTGGIGVDAVLNSLPGEAIPIGLKTLKTGGKFLEIGKRDIYNDASLGLYPFRNNLALFAIDLDQLFKLEPKRMGRMLAEICHQFETGELHALPVTTYSASEAIEAFRLMQQGKHIGKVVINFHDAPTLAVNGEYSRLEFSSEGTYWIAGGLGGFGSELARWMVSRGVRNLVLSGRSKTPRPETLDLITELKAAGARVALMPADITKPDEVRQVVETIDREFPPLRGVIHSAMVLEDKLLSDLDEATLQRVLRPKVLGGWNLHKETLHHNLDLFIVFSSLSSVFGHAGQANYAAANAMLDSLAYYRRSRGLPGLAMNWGHLGEVGYLAQRAELGQRLERQGVLSFTVKQAMECLEYAVQTRAIQQSVLRMDWSLWRGLGITNRVSPRFEHLLVSKSHEENVDEIITADNLRRADATVRASKIECALKGKISSLLGIQREAIQSDRALIEMGLDSLMAVEMRNWIEGHMGVAIPISILMRSDSLTQVVGAICQAVNEETKVNGEANHSATNTQPLQAAQFDSAANTDAQRMLDQIDNMSEDEVNQLLAQMLEQSK